VFTILLLLLLLLLLIIIIIIIWVVTQNRTILWLLCAVFVYDGIHRPTFIHSMVSKGLNRRVTGTCLLTDTSELE